MDKNRSAADETSHTGVIDASWSFMSVRFVPPMAALLVNALPTGDEWIYEAKFDGYRALGLKDGASVKILSRKGNDLTSDYPAIAEALAKLKVKAALLDGEIVAFDEYGRPSFQHLHHRSASSAAIRYFAFDLLQLNGKDMQEQSLTARRADLEKILIGSDVVFSAELPGSAGDVIQAVTDVGLEGIVAKRRHSRYESGKRSGAWQKFKLHRRQEFVIGGYKPENTTFQSIVVGYYENKKLRFASRVRAGFTAAQRAALFELLSPLKTETCPFADLPSSKSSHWGEGVTAEDMKVLKWVKPTLVAEIAFTEWTRDGHLRHSAFVGLRTDKDPRTIVREHPAT
jgi:bifunctional non-homologous end joining protein LigD